MSIQISISNAIGSRYRGNITPPATPLLLDTYTNAAVAYSLRKLRSAYTGNAIRVRRSSDNTEQDFGFVANELDTASMLDFVGYNLWTYSEQWDNVVWTKSQLNLTGTPAYIDVETAPDSTLTSDKIIENTISATHSTARQFTVLNGVTYNVSVYLKSGGRDARVTSAISTVATYQVDVDLTNGTLSGSTFPTSPVLDSVGSGWYRLSYSVTAANSQTRTAMSILLLNGASTNYLGDGTSGAYVWGSQISQTSTVKTYQKTVATAGGNGFVTTWYDQSGNGLNSTMSTAGQQPRIVNAGVLDVKNLKAGFRFDGTDDYLTRTALTALNSGNTYSIFSVAANEDTGIFKDILNTSSSSTPFRLNVAIDTRTTGGTYRIASITNTSGTIYAINLASPDGTANQRLQTVVVDGFNLAGWKNGVAGSTDTYTGTYNNDRFDIGAFFGSRFLKGYIQELIIYPTNQSTNRTAIETNINTYYSIY